MTKKSPTSRPSRFKRLTKKSQDTVSGTDAAGVSRDAESRAVSRIRKLPGRKAQKLKEANSQTKSRTRVVPLTPGVPQRTKDKKRTASPLASRKSSARDLDQQYQKFRPLKVSEKSTPTEVRTVGDEVMVLQVFSGIGMPTEDSQRSESVLPVDSAPVSRKVSSTATSPPAAAGLEVASRLRKVADPVQDLPNSSSERQSQSNQRQQATKSPGTETKAVDRQVALSDEDADLSEAGAFSLKDLQQQIQQFDAQVANSGDEQEEDEAYGEWFRRVILKHPAATWVTASYLYLLIIMALVAVIIHSPETPASLLVQAAFSDPEPLETREFEVAPEMDSLESTASLSEVEDLPIETLSQSVAEAIPETNLPSHLLAADSSAVTAESNSDAAEVEAAGIDRLPMTAVREGSFSVWTEPADPEPGEPYVIVIQIRLPEGVDEYATSDLQGVVVGSDGYRKPIPGYLTGPLPVADGYSQLRVPIVSADEHVQDTIYIKSRLLKETQKLSISFR